jgi:SAM-dependent methyltransferase
MICSRVRMNEPTPRYWEVFFEVYETLPRQGPGNRDSAERALALCRDLRPSPDVLDLGCGVGGQTLHLAERLAGSIVAIDSHAPSIARLQETLADRGLSHRVRASVADMSDARIPGAGFDLVWSEGALYNLGLDHALRLCHQLLRPGGYLAFTEPVWRKDGAPPEVKASFDLDYPGMGRVEEVLASLDRCGFEVQGRFTLPEEAWWDDFYTPMERRIEALRELHAADPEALAILDQLAREPEMHRRHSEYYAYEFFVARSSG